MFVGLSEQAEGEHSNGIMAPAAVECREERLSVLLNR